eukprot:Skav216182  [mRNA]  locus=scaffold2249:142889:151468:+ [translate_table: standard]
MACVAKPPVLLWLFLVAPLRAERPSLGFGILSTDHNDEAAALATKYKWNPNGHIDLDSDFRDLGGYSRDPKRSYDPCRLEQLLRHKVAMIGLAYISFRRMLKCYDGPLCMGCGTTYFAASGSCKKCTGGGVPPWLVKVCLCLTLAASMLVGALAIAYCVYSWDPGQWAGRLADAIFAPGALGNLQRKLLRSEAPVLLQMVQLWVVLAVLASNSNETQDDQASNSRFWELPYLQHVEFAFGSFRELLYLQCYFGGRKVRLALALVSPVVPLLLLLCRLGSRQAPGNVQGGRRLETSAFLRQLPDLYCDQEVRHLFSVPKNQEKMQKRRVVAAAVAYVAMLPEGEVELQLREGKGRPGSSDLFEVQSQMIMRMASVIRCFCMNDAFIAETCGGSLSGFLSSSEDRHDFG